MREKQQQVDCLILEADQRLRNLLETLRKEGRFFPVVVVESATIDSDFNPINPTISPDSAQHNAESFVFLNTYHKAIVPLASDKISQVGFAVEQAIDQAIHQFLQISPNQSLSELEAASSGETPLVQPSLMAQQLLLAKKLKERLGYLGVYYKRNPRNFLRHMTQPQREELLQQLRIEYRDIVLSYFADNAKLNDQLDNFVNLAFFADVPVAQIVEIHMELMDEFSKHLKMEGRSDEMLLDYRLTLIDTIAHLCEMYRRSIPRESPPGQLPTD